MFKKILLASLLAISSSAVMAVPMEGSFSLDGSPTSNSATVDNLANTVKFNPNTFVTSGATGTFTDGMTGSINDFTYTETLGAYTITPLFTVGTFVFNVTSIDYVSESPNKTDIVSLEGYGMMSDSTNSLDDTVFFWSFNSSSNGSWSASVVPAPAALALLGLGLVGLTFVRRKKTA